MVRPETHGRAVFFTDPDQRNEAFSDPIQFGGVGSIIVLLYLELLLVDVVAGIDADLLYDPSRHFSSIGRVMDVGHQRRGVAALAKSVANGYQVLGFP